MVLPTLSVSVSVRTEHRYRYHEAVVVALGSAEGARQTPFHDEMNFSLHEQLQMVPLVIA